ncbi:putative cell survival pathways protein [Dimargaris verticillata]|uniref:Cell survival pathways protein n=1 Tax=Dimargaris verticillata TaxID=2761393 RepID=A0A9W8B192_9FUNG|nr:putative cell survival pathways protein [Dimargaris verticillata]
MLSAVGLSLVTTVESTCLFSGAGVNEFQNFNGSKITLSKDHLSAECKGMAIKTTLTPGSSAAQGSYTVSLTGGKNIHAEFTFQFNNAGYKLGPKGRFYMGNTSLTAGSPDGREQNYIRHVFVPSATVSGTVTVNGTQYNLAGTGLFIHAQSDMKPYTVSQKWNFGYFVGEDVALHMLQLITPEKYGNVWVNKGAMSEGGKVVAVTDQSRITMLETQRDSETGYDVGSLVEFGWKGQTVDGKPFKAQITLRPSNLAKKLDILGAVPFFLRKIIQALITKPYIYEWADQAVATVQIGDEPERTIEGKLYHEATFLN